MRYRMLETVREFGRMQLVGAGEDEAAQAAVDAAVTTFGRLDVLVNNTGINPAFGALTEIEDAASLSMSRSFRLRPLVTSFIRSRFCRPFVGSSPLESSRMSISRTSLYESVSYHFLLRLTSPTALASLAEGETVLDLGSGGGIDDVTNHRRAAAAAAAAVGGHG